MGYAEDVPGWVWRWLGRSAVLLLVTAVSGIVLISAGFFDLSPPGLESYTRELTLRQSIAGQSNHVTWLAESLPAGNYSLRLTAAHQSGEQDVAYGLVIGDEQMYLVAAVSPLGYVALWQDGATSPFFFIPWQTWPHVRPDQESNEIWLDVEDNYVSLRINRELLWRGETIMTGQQIGLLGQSYGDMALIHFKTLEIFY